MEKLSKTKNELAMEQHLKDHPFQYNLLRMLDNKEIVHVNSLFKGYNCTPEECQPTDNAWRKRVICNTIAEICQAVIEFEMQDRGKQQLYFLTPLMPEDIKMQAI